jgi:hypothetical protein
MNKQAVTDIIKSLLCSAAGFSFAGLALADAPITGEVHANSTFADSPRISRKHTTCSSGATLKA